MMNNEESRYQMLKAEVDELEKIFEENKRIKRENLDDRIKDTEDLEKELRMLVEENTHMRQEGQEKMRK
jgi:regulator of replication initiation timing